MEIIEKRLRFFNVLSYIVKWVPWQVESVSFTVWAVMDAECAGEGGWM